jgi:pimeloyl-ACP methyl ester carboxylesterase
VTLVVRHRNLLLIVVLACLLATAAAAQSPPGDADEDSLASEMPGPDPDWIERRGENELVLIHGLGANRSIWNEMAPYLANTFEVFTYELHGHGSTQPLADATITSEVAALRAWIEDQGLIYPTLVGHGLGGMIAMQYAFDHPADVQRLVVIDAAPRQLASAEQKKQVARALLEDYDRFVASRYVNISPLDEVNDRAVDMALRTDSASFASLLLSSFEWDLSEELPRQSVPMLVIGSEFFLPEEGFERDYLEQYGYASARVLSFKRIERTGHYVMLEKPTYLASVILVYVLQKEFEGFE